MHIVEKAVSRGTPQTVKYVQQMRDGVAIETTYVDHARKHIICFSSQAGCAVGCPFCVMGTGRTARFVRSLALCELIEQCENVMRDRKLQYAVKPVLFSCMGVGEPLLNYENVMLALTYLGHTRPNARLALSTSGVRPERIKELANERFPVPFKLQISLHAPFDELRKKLIPSARCLASLVRAAQQYREASRGEIEWNYVLLRGVNDSEECAHALVRLLGPRWHVKLSAYNAVAGIPFGRTAAAATRTFKECLEDGGLSAECYETDGQDISAACGQLTYRR